MLGTRAIHLKPTINAAAKQKIHFSFYLNRQKLTLTLCGRYIDMAIEQLYHLDSSLQGK